MNAPKSRYLVFFQYFGTKYSGVMETLTDQPMLGVQNYLERAALNLRPVTPIKFYVSSRTDAGVHALCNSAHLDVQRAAGKPPFPECVIVSALNYHLKPEPIRVPFAAAFFGDALSWCLGKGVRPPRFMRIMSQGLGTESNWPPERHEAACKMLANTEETSWPKERFSDLICLA